MSGAGRTRAEESARQKSDLKEMLRDVFVELTLTGGGLVPN